MILLLHIIVALFSMVWASYAYIRPDSKKLNVSYGLMAATMTSGTYLVFTSPGHLVEACLIGVGYLAITAGATSLARRKLNTITA